MDERHGLSCLRKEWLKGLLEESFNKSYARFNGWDCIHLVMSSGVSDEPVLGKPLERVESKDTGIGAARNASRDPVDGTAFKDSKLQYQSR